MTEICKFLDKDYVFILFQNKELLILHLETLLILEVGVSLYFSDSTLFDSL